MSRCSTFLVPAIAGRGAQCAGAHPCRSRYGHRVAEPSDNPPPFDGESVLTLTTTQIEEVPVVTAIGELDVMTAPRLLTAIRGVLDSGRGVVVVDLSGISFLSSAGLGVLVDAAETAGEAAAARRARLRLVVDDQRPVLLPLKITGLDHTLALYDTVADALADHPRPSD